MKSENNLQLNFAFKKNQFDSSILKELAQFTGAKIDEIEYFLFSPQKLDIYISYIKKQNIYITQKKIIFKDKSFPYFLQITSIDNSQTFNVFLIFYTPFTHFDSKTEIQNLQQNAKSNLEMISTFTARIAHDFNNVIASILGYAEITQTSLKNNPDLMENVKEIIQNSHKAKDTVKRILSFSTPKRLPKIAIQIDDLINKCLQKVKNNANFKMTIEKKLRILEETFLANPTQIEQVFDSILNNAVKSLAIQKDNPKLIVSTSVIESTKVPQFEHSNKINHLIHIEFNNNGASIKKEIEQEIFTPFFTTNPENYFGLGLSLARGIIESYGGKINHESNTPNETSFHIYLPIKSELKIKPHSPVNANKTEKAILLVDDDQSIIKMRQLTLSSIGYPTICESDPLQALEYVLHEPNRFALILTDEKMPRMGGVELTREIRKINKDVPIIINTGYSEQISDDIIKQLNIYTVLTKPTPLKELQTAIQKAIQTKTELV